MMHTVSPRRGGIKLIIIIVVAVVLGAGISFAVFGRGGGDAAEEAALEVEEEEEVEEEDPAVYIALGDFLVNLESASSLHYLRAEITIGVTGLGGDEEEEGGGGHGGHGSAPADPELSPADDAHIRDAVVRVLSQQSFDGLRADGPSERLRKKMLTELDDSVEDCTVTSLLFTSFVMQ